MPLVQVEYTPKGSHITVQGVKTCEDHFLPHSLPSRSYEACRQDRFAQCDHRHPHDRRRLRQRAPTSASAILSRLHLALHHSIKLTNQFESRALISLPMEATAPTNIKSLSPTCFKASMLVPAGSHQTRKKKSKLWVRTSQAMRTVERPRRKSRPSSETSTKKRKE